MIRRLARALGYVPAHEVASLASQVRRLSARFDAADWTEQTRETWLRADAMSANAACDPATRNTLRMRARHDFHNNPYTYGAVHEIANSIIGVGPRLQMQTEDERVNSSVERAFSDWASCIRLGALLRLARRTQIVSGEQFYRFILNPKIQHPVKLGIQLFEPDQIATIDPAFSDTDGVEFDRWGNPLYYHILKRHPGDMSPFTGDPLGYARVPASEVFHEFLCERPGQSRGIPQMTSALNLSAQRRAMRESVLTAMQAVAGLGAITIETQSGPNVEPRVEDDQWSLQPVRHGTMMALPYGYTAKQLRPEQPGTTYGDFDDRTIVEQGRSMLLPKSIMKGDASSYNFASVRVDMQGFDRMCEIEQAAMADGVLRWIIQRWCMLATKVPRLLPAAARQWYLPTDEEPTRRVECAWVWSAREHIDPAKETISTDRSLQNKTMTYAEEFARRRRDWRDELTQAGRERRILDEAGLLEISPAVATTALGILQRIELIGRDAAVDMLSVMGIPESRARRMADSAMGAAQGDSAPARAADPLAASRRMNGRTQGTNGNGYAT